MRNVLDGPIEKQRYRRIWKDFCRYTASIYTLPLQSQKIFTETVLKAKTRLNEGYNTYVFRRVEICHSKMVKPSRSEVLGTYFHLSPFFFMGSYSCTCIYACTCTSLPIIHIHYLNDYGDSLHRIPGSPAFSSMASSFGALLYCRNYLISIHQSFKNVFEQADCSVFRSVLHQNVRFFVRFFAKLKSMAISS